MFTTNVLSCRIVTGGAGASRETTPTTPVTTVSDRDEAESPYSEIQSL